MLLKQSTKSRHLCLKILKIFSNLRGTSPSDIPSTFFHYLLHCLGSTFSATLFGVHFTLMLAKLYTKSHQLCWKILKFSIPEGYRHLLLVHPHKSAPLNWKVTFIGPYNVVSFHSQRLPTPSKNVLPHLAPPPP